MVSSVVVARAKSVAPKPLFDRSMLLPSPTTPSARFARDVMAGAKAQAWVEEVIGERLPKGDFAEAFKNGQGLCRLINTFRPGSISKIETSSSPFKQMANISAFIQACRALGVHEQALFETLDLYNEKRLQQVVRCLFSLSEIVRTNMPDFPGPHLSTPEKPDVDPAVKAVVDISKGRHPHSHGHSAAMPPFAPGWGSSTTAVHLDGTMADPAAAAAGGPCTPRALHLALPKHMGKTGNGCCLSPGAHASGQLTYGIYEGGGVAASKCLAKDGSDGEGVGLVEPGTAEALAGQRRVDDKCGGAASEEGGRAGGAGEFGNSTVPVVSTPRHPLSVPRDVNTPGGSGLSAAPMPRSGTDREEELKRRKEAIAKHDAEMEVALWIEGVSGVTFPGRFWSSLKDGVLLCKMMNVIQPGLVPSINEAHAPFPEMENITAFLTACRKLGVAEHSLFDMKDLHEKRDMALVVRCMHVLGATVQSSVPDFKGPFLGKKTESWSRVNARGLRKRLGKGPGARGGIRASGLHPKGMEQVCAADAILLEHPDPTVTMTPAESPSGKRQSRPRETWDSGAGLGGTVAAMPASLEDAVALAATAAEEEEEESGPVSGRVNNANTPSPLRRVGGAVGDGTGAGAGAGTLLPPVIFEDEVANVGGEEEGRANGVGKEGGAPTVVRSRAETGLTRRGAGGGGAADGGGARRRSNKVVEDRGEGVISQIQKFVELHTQMPWRISGDMYESLRDGWQLALLANVLRAGAVRRVHNSIQPAKHVHNIANFLIACRRMGVARALLFDIDDLYANRSQTKVARTLLALRALAADPDFSRARPSSLMGSSLLISAAAKAGAASASTTLTPTSSSAPAGLWS